VVGVALLDGSAQHPRGYCGGTALSSSGIYWARFEERHGSLWRFDTRIYAEAIDGPRRGDRPVGCIVGKNPGSALPAEGLRPGKGRAALQAIELGSDRFLPTVRAVLRKSHIEAGLVWPARSYVLVLNLFYLCNRDLRGAKRALAAVEAPPICPAERRPTPWTWLAWGGPDAQLEPLRARFRRRRRAQPFFVDTKKGSLEQRVPAASDFARHTQGMAHDEIVAFLAARLMGMADSPGIRRAR
jgi:hypothetical protein